MNTPCILNLKPFSKNLELVKSDNRARADMEGTCTTDILNHSWVGSLHEGPSGQVLLFARQSTDAAFVSGCLEESGYFRGATNVSDSKSQKKLHGLIICYRNGNDSFVRNILQSAKADRVLVLSDCCNEQSIVSMLGQGAHHYLNINDSRQVLVARLAASLRVHWQAAAKKLIVNDILFDSHRRKVFRAGHRVCVSPKEYELAHYMFCNIERIVTNEELMCAVWSLPSCLDSRRIDTAACRVRKKMSLVPESGWELKRIRTVGYILMQIGQPIRASALSG